MSVSCSEATDKPAREVQSAPLFRIPSCSSTSPPQASPLPMLVGTGGKSLGGSLFKEQAAVPPKTNRRTRPRNRPRRNGTISGEDIERPCFFAAFRA